MKCQSGTARKPLNGLKHKSDRERAVPHDDLRRNPEHVVPEPPKIPVRTRVCHALPSVDLAIHLHDEPKRGSDEVRDLAVPEHDLPPKRDAELATAELPPERALRLLRVEPHAPSASGEDVVASGRNGARRLEHGCGSARHGARAQPSKRRLRDVRGASSLARRCGARRATCAFPRSPSPTQGATRAHAAQSCVVRGHDTLRTC
jgi:hypothetical protein